MEKRITKVVVKSNAFLLDLICKTLNNRNNWNISFKVLFMADILIMFKIFISMQGFRSIKLQKYVFVFYSTILATYLHKFRILLSDALLINSHFDVICFIAFWGGSVYKRSIFQLNLCAFWCRHLYGALFVYIFCSGAEILLLWRFFWQICFIFSANLAS